MMDPYNPNQNQLQYNGMNPNAMSNMSALQGVNGTQMPGTFNRVPDTQFNPAAQYVAPNMPVANPQNVQTQIMPNNNLQTY
jgi:hypothetical protein